AGQSPSLADIVKMVHPKPSTPRREAFYGYMLGRPHDAAVLPELVVAFERFKHEVVDEGAAREVPDLPFMLLSGLPLRSSDWVAIARNASWQTTRMNLNTFARHGVFKEPGMTERIAERLRDANEIRRARAFPYQLLAAYRQSGEDVPQAVRDALQDAM